jgi:hypothetical protein
VEAQTAAQVLARQHADLEKKLADEISRPLPDSYEIAKIKRQKLKMKDRLASFSATRH